MNPKLKHLTELYATLERGVQEIVREQSGPLCAQCTCVCCRADICEESIESPFLQKVHEQTDLFSDRFGFLTETGCGLASGRPPVCYQYFCDDIFYHQPDELHEELLRTLGALIIHTGRNALGDLHLVDILQEEKLEQIDFQRLEKQFEESFQALEVLRTFYNEGTLPEASDRVLKRITFSEED